MPELAVVVLVGLVSAVVVLAIYHALGVVPALRRQAAIVASLDGLLGGQAGPASERLAAAEAAVATESRERLVLAGRVEALERVARSETPRIGFVRYNAFDDVGSDLSYALALLSKDGDGVVLTSIYSREETRTYGKAVAKFQPAVDASSEERAAIDRARAAAT